jgi:predicted 3-demethylubiquinone-9 3-methyltransferase (glyoxalase superfamily)
MSQMTPCLWFDDQAEAAAKYYVKIFPKSKILAMSRYGDAGPGPKGSVLTVEFRLNGQDFLALNGGPLFTFSEAISFVIYCKTQKEIDRYWKKLTANGGVESRCGWLKDKFGLSWQVVPANLSKMMTDKNTARRERVMKALLQMGKLDIAALKRAAKAS